MLPLLNSDWATRSVVILGVVDEDDDDDLGEVVLGGMVVHETQISIVKEQTFV